MTQNDINTINAVLAALDGFQVQGRQTVTTLAAVMNTLSELAAGGTEEDNGEH